MRKTLQDVAIYLKEILVPETKEIYHIDPIYSDISSEQDIHLGIRAFREFLVRFYDVLISEGNSYHRTKKVAHEYENRTTLSVYYPFIHNLSTLLINIGYLGVISSDDKSIHCDGKIFIEKLSVPKNLECIDFLIKCGINFEGIDILDKKQKLTELKSIKVTYPDSPKMFIGMKAMSILEINHRTLVNQDVFLRCDYRPLKIDKPDSLTILQDTIIPLSSEVKDFALLLHNRYIDKGVICTVEIKGFHIYMKYSYKRKDIWGINSSLSNGYHINVKSTKTDEYPELVGTLPMILKELIEKGYGCGRKREIGHCDGGCRGIPITLDETILDIRDDIIAWFDQELLHLGKK